jgi:hypothetical protein
MLQLYLLKYHDFTTWREPTLKKLDKNNFNISHFECQPEICEILFRFKAEHLRKLYLCLRIDRRKEGILIENGSRFLGEEVFLFSLMTLSCPYRLCDQQRLFGREITQWSRAFKWFNNHIYSTFLDILINSLNYSFINGYLSYCAKYIQ